jgi:hypothetical protein
MPNAIRTWLNVSLIVAVMAASVLTWYSICEKKDVSDRAFLIGLSVIGVSAVILTWILNEY